MITRRDFLKLSGASAAALYAAAHGNPLLKALAAPAAMGLSDPAMQPKFVELAPNALNPDFIFEKMNAGPLAGQYNVTIKETTQYTGLVNPKSGKPLSTTVWGYGYDDERGVTWPGRTFQVKNVAAGGEAETTIRWDNQLFVNRHLLPVDTNLHWCFSLPGYQQYSIKKNGVPVITHLHGGNTDFQFDGNPEFFYTPDYQIVGPQWFNNELNGVVKDFKYNNDVPAGNLWYHDHALGITRLNVYAGLAGFYFVRDNNDTGDTNNTLGLPAFPYELAYAIQDRMFTDKGELFYPAFPGDPYYEDFINDEGAILPPDLFRNGGPTALAEFFGDHMVVNGKIWPKENVEPRNYRMHLLNGCDSRFMVLQFVAVNADDTDFTNAGAPIPFWVIGSDQGLGTPTQTDTLVFEPGGRYDIVFDFKGLQGKRIIMKNIGGDEPFGGDIPGPQIFGETDRIMAFDVADMSDVMDAFNTSNLPEYEGVANDATPRKVALFEGKDEFGRLQPLLGTVASDLSSATAYTWFQPTTETPARDSTEVWEVYNFTGDAHPVHLHLVNFEILGRKEITFDVDEDHPQFVPQHNGSLGTVAAISDIVEGADVNLDENAGYVERAPKDMVTALPEQVTRIKAHFDKSGRYVWHCHILSHEDHEMMRVLQVGPGA